MMGCSAENRQGHYSNAVYKDRLAQEPTKSSFWLYTVFTTSKVNLVGFFSFLSLLWPLNWGIFFLCHLFFKNYPLLCFWVRMKENQRAMCNHLNTKDTEKGKLRGVDSTCLKLIQSMRALVFLYC